MAGFKKEYYLAHPFNSRKRIRRWELDFEKRTGISLINPFYDVKRLDIEYIDAGRKDISGLDSKELVENDLALVKKAGNGLIAIIDKSITIGTIQEIVYAYLWNKEIYSIVTNGKHKHPWLDYHSDKIFTSNSDFEEYVIQVEGY